MVPNTRAQYDYTKRLARGDIIFLQTEYTVILKCSKTNQFRDKISSIQVLCLSALLDLQDYGYKFHTFTLSNRMVHGCQTVSCSRFIPMPPASSALLSAFKQQLLL